ncbi:hypothetical protein LTR28_009357 [Elasticomyces elasticus]|nr:hypothetical protein LTR28_009357 [Elasticomyces elasticus]
MKSARGSGKDNIVKIARVMPGTTTRLTGEREELKPPRPRSSGGSVIEHLGTPIAVIIIGARAPNEGTLQIPTPVALTTSKTPQTLIQPLRVTTTETTSCASAFTG